MKDEELFIKTIGEMLPVLKPKMKAYCNSMNKQWSEDVFMQTILNCYNAIARKGGLVDKSEKGISDYFFNSFYTNIKREALYSRNAKRDNTSDIFGDYETYSDKHELTLDEKIKQDCFKDFSVMYLMRVAEENFDDESFHLFNHKTLGNLTYKELQAKYPNTKAIRQKVASVKRFLKDNVTKDEINKAFEIFMNKITIQDE